jgi:hypothetical protein
MRLRGKQRKRVSSLRDKKIPGCDVQVAQQKVQDKFHRFIDLKPAVHGLAQPVDTWARITQDREPARSGCGQQGLFQFPGLQIRLTKKPFTLNEALIPPFENSPFQRRKITRRAARR